MTGLNNRSQGIEKNIPIPLVDEISQPIQLPGSESDFRKCLPAMQPEPEYLQLYNTGLYDLVAFFISVLLI